jgi:D-alanyl-D-alanine dipeptidase
MTALRPDDEARRAFWAQSLEEALPFLEAIYAYPVEESLEPLVPLREAVGEAGVEVTFSDRPHVGGRPRLFLLREGLVKPLVAVAREMNQRGWVLRIEDAYRTEEMQRHLARAEFTLGAPAERLRWECGGERPPLEVVVRRLAALIAPAPKVGTHMSGSALDISVFDRESGEEVERGGPYLALSEITPMDSPFVSAPARRNREEITALLARHGFVAYPWEYWHYSGGDAYAEHLTASGRPARYGAVHAAPEGGAVTPLADPFRLLNSSKELAEEIEKYWG